MNRSDSWRWGCVAAWGALLFALQGFLASSTALEAWTPNLGLVLMLSLLGRVKRAQLVFVALSMAFARAATSIEPPMAILAAHLFVAALAHTLRGVFEISSAVPRSTLAGLNVLLLGGWFEFVRRVRDAQAAGGALDDAKLVAGFDVFAPSLACAMSTALVALLAGPWLVRLPGLAPLWRKTPWRAVASFR